ncbi:MAG: hypothetical protein AAGF74_14050 [Pseudomonadota bacterium]
MSTPFEYRHRARAPLSVAAVIAVLVGLVVMRLAFDAALWIVVPLALLTLPALNDMRRDHSAVLWVDDAVIGWRSGTQDIVEVPLGDVTKARLRLGFDLSQKITLDVRDGPPLRVPLDCVPRGRAIEHVLAERRVPVSRGFFA